MAKDGAYTQTFVNGSELDGSELNLVQSEGQVEWETRDDDLHADGCVGSSAWTPSINGSQIEFAAGSLYFRGKRFEGDTLYLFTAAKTAGTYYVYISNATNGLDASTSRPSAANGYCICSVAWDGVSALSSLTDLRKIGSIASAQLQRDTIGGTASDYFDVYLGIGSEEIHYIDHSDEAVFVDNPLPICYCTQAGVEVELVLSADDAGDGTTYKTDGSGFLVRVKNISCSSDYPGSYDYAENTTIRVFYERSGLIA